MDVLNWGWQLVDSQLTPVTSDMNAARETLKDDSLQLQNCLWTMPVRNL